MLLSLPPSCKIRHVTTDGKTSAITVEELAKQDDPGVYVYDFHGNAHRVRIGAEVSEQMYMIACGSGEPLFVGEKHTVLCRPVGTASYVRLPLSMLDGTMQAHVRLPHKRITPHETIVDAFDYDEKEQNLILKPERASDFIRLMERAASCGVTVKRHRTEKKITLDGGRPLCFANKLLIGAFQSDPMAAMDTLASSGVIQPWKMFSQAVVDEVVRTDIIFEGNCIYAESMFITAKPVGRASKVRHITPEDPNVPVELSWMMS